MHRLPDLASPIATLLAVTARSWFRGARTHQSCPACCSGGSAGRLISLRSAHYPALANPALASPAFTSRDNRPA